MSELINNKDTRINQLTAFCSGLIEGGKGRSLMDEHWDLIHSVTPFEVMEVLDRLLVMGIPHDTVKHAVGKIINAFSASLLTYEWEQPGQDHFIHFLMLENREVEKLMEEMKVEIKLLFNGEFNRQNDPVEKLKALLKKL